MLMQMVSSKMAKSIAHRADLPITLITYRLHLPPTPQHSPNTLSTLALIKSSPSLDSMSPLGSQLHFVMLSSSAPPALVADDGAASGSASLVTIPTAQSTPYDGLHSLVHWGVAPWFDSYVNSKAALADGPSTVKKGGEAQMGEQLPRSSLNHRHSGDEEEICRAGAIAASLEAERRDT